MALTASLDERDVGRRGCNRLYSSNAIGCLTAKGVHKPCDRVFPCFNPFGCQRLDGDGASSRTTFRSPAITSPDISIRIDRQARF